MPSTKKRVRIYPYKMGSKGASILAEALRFAGVRCLKVYPDGKFRPREDDLIINWGSPRVPKWLSRQGRDHRFLNQVDSIMYAHNKLESFKMLVRGGVEVPNFTTDREHAYSWCKEGNKERKLAGFARKYLRGSSGKGIEPFYHYTEYGIEGEAWPTAPLYVEYIKKSAEYRVHVFKGQVIDIQQKKKRRSIPNEEVNYQIRSYNNGWVFTRDEVNPPQSILDNSIRAVAALGLDFGAVDVIWNEHYQKAYVLEVNTAPGLEGQTIQTYVQAFKQEIKQRSR